MNGSHTSCLEMFLFGSYQGVLSISLKIQEEEEETHEEVFEDEDDDIESSKNVLDVEDLGVMMKSSQKVK